MFNARRLNLLCALILAIGGTTCGASGNSSEAASAFRQAAASTGLCAAQFQWNALDVVCADASRFNRKTLPLSSMQAAGLVFRTGAVTGDGKAVVGATDDSVAGVSTTGADTLWSMKIRAVKELTVDATGDTVAFSSTGTGVFVLTVAGRDLNQVAKGGETPRLSPDGARLATVVDSGIVVLDFGTGDTKRLAGGSRPAWLPDSKSVSYLSLLGAFEVLDVATSRSTPFLDGRGVVSPVEWSPDGQWQLFARERRTWWARNVASESPADLIVRRASDGDEFVLATFSLRDQRARYGWVVNPDLASAAR